MIHTQTIGVVYPLAELLAKKGVQVTAIETTPVDKLIGAGLLPVGTVLNKNDDGATVTAEFIPTIEEKILGGSLTKNAYGEVTHDVVMDDLVESISKIVKANLDLSKNVVNPIVKAVVLETETFITAANNIRKTDIEVKAIFLPTIANSSILEELLSKYSEVPTDPTELVVKFDATKYTGGLDKPALLALAKTGADSFDSELESLCKGLSEDYVVNLFKSIFIFAGVTEDGGNWGIKTLKGLTYNGYADVNKFITPLLVHLWARKLAVEIPDGANVGLATYKAEMAKLVSQTAVRAYSALESFNRDIKANVLVFDMPTGSFGDTTSSTVCIKVLGEVYNKFLNAGGSPETLMGSFITTKETGYTKLLEGKETFEKEWTRREKILDTKVRLNHFNNAVEGLKRAVAIQIVDLDPELLPVPKAVLHERLNEAITLLYGNFYEDLWTYARKIVCNVMFPHTDALAILCAIDNVSKNSPEMEVREAALIATMEIVTDWVSKLLKVTYCEPEV